MNKHDFKRKRFGYGWVPVTASAWLAVVAYLAALVLSGLLLLHDIPSDEYRAEVGIYLALVAIYTVVLVAYTRNRGPEPKWRWGKRDDDDPDADY